MPASDRIALAPGLEISRVVTGLWQVADMERGRARLDRDRAARRARRLRRRRLRRLRHGRPLRQRRGDHRRVAAEPAGPRRAARSPNGARRPGPMTREVVRAGVQRSLDRLRVERIDLLQFHWWTFEHPGYLDAMLELAALRDEGLIAPPRRSPTSTPIICTCCSAKASRSRRNQVCVLAARPPRRRATVGAVPAARRQAARLRHARPAAS